MDDRLVALVVVALCVVALGFTAASLSSAPQQTAGSDSGPGQPGSELPDRNQSGAGGLVFLAAGEGVPLAAVGFLLAGLLLVLAAPEL